MISSPTKRFLRFPIPAAVCCFPMSVSIRPPIRIVLCYRGLENVAVILCIDPMSVRGEVVVKDVVGVVEVGLAGRCFLVDTGHWSRQAIRSRPRPRIRAAGVMPARIATRSVAGGECWRTGVLKCRSTGVLESWRIGIVRTVPHSVERTWSRGRYRVGYRGHEGDRDQK